MNIEKLTPSQLYVQLGKALHSQGNGPQFSHRLERRIARLRKELSKAE